MTVASTPSAIATPIADLRRQGQAVWLDYIRRHLLTSGELRRLVEADGVTGVTSNPAIFEQAIAGSDDYKAAIETASANPHVTAKAVFEELALEDIRAAADVLRPVYDRTGAADGYVSLEVAPDLARDTTGTLDEARRLWHAVDRPNLMIKVPATAEGLPAIRELLTDGINVNITLLFARAAYVAVAHAYLEALDARVARGQPIDRLASVASFFVSRIDTAVDALLAERLHSAGGAEHPRLERLFGTIAIANAKAAYREYKRIFSGPRWAALAGRGAHVQRLLWASTSVKNPRYRDTLYVEELIGPDTVNTVPPETLAAFRDHGRARASLEERVDDAFDTLRTLEETGISLDAVTSALLDDGIKKFADPFAKLLGAIERRCREANAARINHQSYTLPPDVAAAVSDALTEWDAQGGTRRLWTGDASLWTGADEARWLGWIGVVEQQLADLGPPLALQAEARAGGFTHALLLGMGGSSLCAEVWARTCGTIAGSPELLVLDSTDPAQISTFEDRIDPARTLFIVSSKSGSTLEPNILKAYFLDRVRQALGPRAAAERFIAITDPGSSLEQQAKADGFRHVLPGVRSIGGRYSALSNFGIAPAAIMGLDIERLLEEADRMLHACAPGVPAEENPGLVLGTIIGVLAGAGLDKLTLITSPGLSSLGAWVEQLIAESTGKQGRGVIPVDREQVAAPDRYGPDRLFVYIRFADGAEAAQDAAVRALEDAGRPVVRIDVATRYDLAEEFMRWEVATAIAGALLHINPFDQPDVEASKIATRRVMAEYEARGHLAPEAPWFEEDGVALFADARSAEDLRQGARAASLTAYLRAHFDRLNPGDYFAILAYLPMTAAHEQALQAARHAVRDRKRVATCLGFGPRFLHSTGQLYKGGPNTGVFLQVTCDDALDLPVPGQRYTFGVVKAAQARGDFQVLVERGRRALRVHLGPRVDEGLRTLAQAILEAVA